MAGVLLQVDPKCEKSVKVEEAEEVGGPYIFEDNKHNLRLRPLAYISRPCTLSEASYHSYTGEACAGKWAIAKFERYLLGRTFTWITDCSGIREFMEGTDIPTHTHQRWRQYLLRFLFIVVHRSAEFLVECDTFSRYNKLIDIMRVQHIKEDGDKYKTKTVLALATMPFFVSPLDTSSDPPFAGQSTLLKASVIQRNIVSLNSGSSSISAATATSRIMFDITEVEARERWTQVKDTFVSSRTLTKEIQQRKMVAPDWIIGHMTATEWQHEILHFKDMTFACKEATVIMAVATHLPTRMIVP